MALAMRVGAALTEDHMQFLTSLFGGSANTAVGAAFALGVVCVLIVIAVWVLKFVFQTTGTVARAKNRRLMLVESMPLEGKRQVLLLRRDGVEHLILTGGPQDLVVETNIPVEKPQNIRAMPAAGAPHLVPPHATPATMHPPHEDKPTEAAPVAIDGLDLAGASRSAVERLREITRPLGRRATRSLRYTGLMRAGRLEVIPGYLDGARRDSAKTTPVAEAKGGDGSVTREGFKADGA
jgi:hypothetical protein